MCKTFVKVTFVQQQQQHGAHANIFIYLSV